jgi:O-antigen ligase
LWTGAPLAAYVGWSLASTAWSLAPSASVIASAWWFAYLAVFLVGATWPRLAGAATVAVSLAIVALGVDRLLLGEGSLLLGTWFNKNVQGAQLLLLVPLFSAWAMSRRRWSPYPSLLLGSLLFLVTLTMSVSTQVLAAMGVVASFVATRRAARKTSRLAAWMIPCLVLAGFALTWFTVRPEAVQVFGFGVGRVDGQSVTKSNVDGSLNHRVEMLGYGLSAGAETFPWGTGAGTTRDIYPALKDRAGVNVPDLHNYYAQTFMTHGIVGLVLLLLLLGLPMLLLVFGQTWVWLVPLFLFAGYLAFDVAAYFPGLMAAFFSLLGVGTGLSMQSLARREPCRIRRLLPTTPTAHAVPKRIPSGVRTGYLVVALSAAAGWVWWSMPCERLECALGRRLGNERTVASLAQSVASTEALALADGTVARNPSSLWAFRFRARVASESGVAADADLSLRREIAGRFPVGDVGVYLDWRDAAIRAGEPEEARRAIRRGIAYYAHSRALVSRP